MVGAAIVPREHDQCGTATHGQEADGCAVPGDNFARRPRPLPHAPAPDVIPFCHSKGSLWVPLLSDGGTDVLGSSAFTGPTLVVIRGNSGSGKTTIAREVRRRYGRVAPAFITATARNALDLGYHVVLEGILHTGRYAAALHQLINDHAGPSHFYYLDVSFEETVRRHRTRPEQVNFTPEQMRDWYEQRDVLGCRGEVVVDELSAFEQTVDTILRTSALLDAPPLTPCPVRCPHCADKEPQ